MMVSGWPRAAQRPAGERGDQAPADVPDSHERPPAPDVPTAAKPAGFTCGNRVGAEFLARSAAMAWVITGCMTFSLLADHPSGRCH
jgi:hypothetical protein